MEVTRSHRMAIAFCLGFLVSALVATVLFARAWKRQDDLAATRYSLSAVIVLMAACACVILFHFLVAALRHV